MLTRTRRASPADTPCPAYRSGSDNSTDVTTAAHPLTGWPRCVERIAAVRPRTTLTSTRPSTMIPTTRVCQKASAPSDTPNVGVLAVTA